MLPWLGLWLGLGVCKVTVDAPPPWQEGDKSIWVLNLTITNPDAQSIAVPWQLRVHHHGFGAVRQAWNWRITGNANGTVEGWVEDSNQVLTAQSGNQVNVGFTVEATDASMPEGVWVGDEACVAASANNDPGRL